MAVPGMRRAVAQRIIGKEFDSDPEKELGKAEKCGARIITYLDSTYPELLREIHQPPMVLYVKGQELPSEGRFVAVVGSRNPSHYGIKVAERMGTGIARKGFGVVSGLALGIDAAGHWGCILGQGFTIAVLGTGIDRVYPATNKKLMGRVLENGAAVTEFPIGTAPEPRNFPIRNRIISGLSKGVLVVEATRKSGSLITASFALDQGREIFAVPGSINSFKSRGSHFLIKQGAKLVENVEDIVDEVNPGQPAENPPEEMPEASENRLDLNNLEKKIYDLVGDYPVHIDEIVRMGDLDPAEVLSSLMKLELGGIVKQLPGKMFVR
jgi:DNA processing protein